MDEILDRLEVYVTIVTSMIIGLVNLWQPYVGIDIKLIRFILLGLLAYFLSLGVRLYIRSHIWPKEDPILPDPLEGMVGDGLDMEGLLLDEEGSEGIEMDESEDTNTEDYDDADDENYDSAYDYDDESDESENSYEEDTYYDDDYDNEDYSDENDTYQNEYYE